MKDQWRWELFSGLLTINVRARGFDISQAMHTLRSGWRLWCWDQFINGNRHESPQLAHTSARELLQVDFCKLRATMEADAAAR